MHTHKNKHSHPPPPLSLPPSLSLSLSYTQWFAILITVFYQTLRTSSGTVHHANQIRFAVFTNNANYLRKIYIKTITICMITKIYILLKWAHTHTHTHTHMHTHTHKHKHMHTHTHTICQATNSVMHANYWWRKSLKLTDYRSLQSMLYWCLKSYEKKFHPYLEFFHTLLSNSLILSSTFTLISGFPHYQVWEWPKTNSPDIIQDQMAFLTGPFLKHIKNDSKLFFYFPGKKTSWFPLKIAGSM